MGHSMLKLSSSIKVKNYGDKKSRLLLITDNIDYPKPLRSKAAYIGNEKHSLEQFSAILNIDNKNRGINYSKEQTHIELNEDFTYLKPGDVIRLEPEHKRIRTLFRKESNNNFILITERCNHRCLMCSQPPKNVDDSVLMDEALELINFLPKDLRSLGITGGEPTLYGKKLLELIDKIKTHLPSTSLDILTNGRAFSNINYAIDFAKINHPDLRIAIPLYSYNPEKHNYIVQSQDAFDETIQGIINLKSQRQKVEIRVVLHKQSIPDLIKLAKYISKNLRFVDHVALMGLEITGYTRANLEELWIDQWDYKDILSDAIEILNDYNIPVSIYNHQLCLINEKVYRFYKHSISDWKNEYLDECNECTRKHSCGGFFSTQIRYKHSKNITPFKN